MKPTSTVPSSGASLPSTQAREVLKVSFIVSVPPEDVALGRCRSSIKKRRFAQALSLDENDAIAEESIRRWIESDSHTQASHMPAAGQALRKVRDMPRAPASRPSIIAR